MFNFSDVLHLDLQALNSNTTHACMYMYLKYSHLFVFSLPNSLYNLCLLYQIIRCIALTFLSVLISPFFSCLYSKCISCHGNNDVIDMGGV